MKNPKNVKRGKKSKAAGSAFEKVVRKDLESKGWIVDRCSNNVEFEEVKSEPKYEINDNGKMNARCFLDAKFGKLIPAKITWRRTPKGMFPMGLNSGFPDFVAFRNTNLERIRCSNCKSVIKVSQQEQTYEVIGVESKMSGTLDKIEKQKCRWLLDNGIFSKILVARKTKVKNRIVVEYEDFLEIEKRMKK